MPTTASFVTTGLIGGGVLVEGTDVTGKSGTVVLHSPLWSKVKEYRRIRAAEEVFNSTVVEFFKPLTDAAEALQSDIEGDDISTVVLEEGAEGVASIKPKKIELDEEGIILRLLEEGKSDLLRWVGGRLVAVA